MPVNKVTENTAERTASHRPTNVSHWSRSTQLDDVCQLTEVISTANLLTYDNDLTNNEHGDRKKRRQWGM